jgi:hypothetical protein
MDLEACILNPSKRFLIHEDNARASLVMIKVRLNLGLSLSRHQR